MPRRELQVIRGNNDGMFRLPELSLSWSIQEGLYPCGGLFASIGHTNSSAKLPCTDLYVKYASPPEFKCGPDAGSMEEEEEESDSIIKRKTNHGLKIRIRSPSLIKLISGALAGAVSRTAVAPLETIRTHLMVGSSGDSTAQVFHNIINTDGWKGLFRGNFVNVIRVAPSRAIELFTYDTVKTSLTPKIGEAPKLPIPSSLIAGACAGVSSTILTYPLELLKTRMTIQGDAYKNLADCFLKVLKEGPTELYRGLTPSIIGVVPYAAINYYTYDTLKKAYKSIFKTEEIGNIATLLMGSVAGAVSSTATYPLEVARKHMQVGSVGGRQVYKNMLHALVSILEEEGMGGLYKGVAPSCFKLVPAAGISFMCYEACKKILIDKEDE